MKVRGSLLASSSSAKIIPQPSPFLCPHWSRNRGLRERKLNRTAAVAAALWAVASCHAGRKVRSMTLRQVRSAFYWEFLLILFPQG
jgi:hypothetical protein